jgi:hypothetical protein
MSVSSPCEICGRGEVRDTCDRCGKLVCEKHYDESLGYCTECVAEVGRGESSSSEEEDLPDGVDTYRF